MLRDIEAIQKRPGMYVGNTADGTGLQNMMSEVVKNAFNEAVKGWAKRIEITLNPDGSAMVSDDGRGMPVELIEGEQISIAEAIATQLHAGGRFVYAEYRTPGLLDGVGIVVVNALSEFFELRTWSDGNEWFMRFCDGKPERSFQQVGPSNSRRGTEIAFRPSPLMFTNTRFDLSAIEQWLDTFVSSLPGLQIVLADRRGPDPSRTVLM